MPLHARIKAVEGRTHAKAASFRRRDRTTRLLAEARVMKMADAGFRPAFNAQLAVDADTQIIAALRLSNAGSNPYVPVPAGRNPGSDPCLSKNSDSVAIAQWRIRMGST